MPADPYRLHVTILSLAVTIGSFAGCSPTRQLQRVDREAYRTIADAQQQALGRQEVLAIEPPSMTFRRQLIENQNLITAGSTSLGSEKLALPTRWPEGLQLPVRQPVEGTDTLELELVDPDGVVSLNLMTALSLAAGNSREYQTRKEDVFRAALSLDLARQEFRTTLRGLIEGSTTADLNTGPGRDQTQWSADGTATGTLTQRLESGASVTTRLGVDVVRLLTPNASGSFGMIADASVAIPLLRGSGRHIAREGLTQAERETVYAIWEFERFKSVFGVRVATAYLGVLQQLDQVRNAEENYRRLVFAAGRARRLAEGGRLPEIQVDQATQDELRARNRWISARESYQRRLDDFKILLGLPTDALIELDRDELDNLAEGIRSRLPGVMRGFDRAPDPDQADDDQPPEPGESRAVRLEDIRLEFPDPADRGPLELEYQRALHIALARRVDLFTREGRVEDAQRRVVVDANALGAELTLLGRANFVERRVEGSDRYVRPDRGLYSAVLTLDLPIERTRERVELRRSLIELERAVRNFQAFEDQIKLEIRDALRRLLEFRESVRIQTLAVAVATRRVESTNLFLQAGRAEIRDLLEAQESLLAAQNGLTAAMISYRTAELELQRDLGVLQIDHRGLWTEYDPVEEDDLIPELSRPENEP